MSEYIEDYMIEQAEENLLTEGDAMWAVKKVKALHEELHKVANTARVEKERIEVWEESRSRKINNDISHYETKLQNYLIQQGKKTISLPHGEIKFRKQQPRYIYNNNLSEFVEKNMPEYMKVKQELDWSALKKDVEVRGGIAIHRITGEVLPIDIEDQPDKFSVKIYD